MKKVFSFAAALLALPFSALAGGFLTNTNQSVQYVRNPAQNAVISVGAAYFNPAGCLVKYKFLKVSKINTSLKTFFIFLRLKLFIDLKQFFNNIQYSGIVKL